MTYSSLPTATSADGRCHQGEGMIAWEGGWCGELKVELGEGKEWRVE